MNAIRHLIAPLVTALVLLAGGAYFASSADSDADGAVVGKTKFFQYRNGAAAGGYDVVAYFDDAEAVAGEQVYEASYAGQLWHFKSMENREKFLAAPKKYIPQYGGHCAYGVAQGYLVRGDPEAWTVRDGKLYLNYSKSVRNSWLADAAGFILRSEKNWPGLNK